MAVNSFDDVLSAIKDDGVKQGFLKEVESNPDIKAGWLRQSDYSRNMNELKQWSDLGKTWNTWKLENWDESLDMTNGEANAFKTIRELETENIALKGKVDTEVTFQELQSEIDKLWDKKSQGVLTETEFNSKFGSKFVPKEDYEKDVNARLGNVLAGVENLYGQTSVLAMKHMKEFDEIINPLDIVGYANKNGVSDLGKAYDLMVEGRRTERTDATRKQEIEDAKRLGREEALKEQAMGPAGRIPTDGGSPEMGHLQARLFKAAKPEGEATGVPDEVKMDGSGVLAHNVAALYRQGALAGK